MPYYYYPVVVSFEEEELEEYLDLSRRIGKAMLGKEDKEPSEYAKALMIKRARLVAGTYEKVERLAEVMREYKDENHLLIYCGATTVQDVDYEENKASDAEMRQVDVVVKMLGKKLGMKVARFTAEETMTEREAIKRRFSEGNSLQALVAIRCLDEGVNIPRIRRAFILASSTNPKEYIQRRGRVLRLAPEKNFAYIHDFVVSPLPINSVNNYGEDTIRLSRSLVKNEIERMRDFAALAENSHIADKLIADLIENYGVVE